MMHTGLQSHQASWGRLNPPLDKSFGGQCFKRGDCSFEYLSYPSFAKIASFAFEHTYYDRDKFPTDTSVLSVSLGYSDCTDISTTVSKITWTFMEATSQ
ncbi:unnamed protein product [Blepharisma stoltei]|uniref:Uncharacterized protein n=1 Tax=Blepharisma stoltei TaxID=1481888 RepID=A0AAU9JE40_9CILI|nr:unnamed protein product [Blepharisma stoltei]